MNRSKSFINKVQIIVLLVGILLLSFPVIFSWKLSGQELDHFQSLKDAIGSTGFKLSLIVSMAITAHMLTDLIGHNIIFSFSNISYKNTISIFILQLSIIIPSLFYLLYVIPYQDIIVYHCVSNSRYIFFTSAIFTYLNFYGGSIWSNWTSVITCLLVMAGCVLRFYALFNEKDFSLTIISYIFFIISSIIPIFPTREWILYLYKQKTNSKQMTTDEYCCTVYLVGAYSCLIGLLLLLVITGMGPQDEVSYLITTTVLFSLFYLIVTVFQSKAMTREAAMLQVNTSLYYSYTIIL